MALRRGILVDGFTVQPQPHPATCAGLRKNGATLWWTLVGYLFEQTRACVADRTRSTAETLPESFWIERSV